MTGARAEKYYREDNRWCGHVIAEGTGQHSPEWWLEENDDDSCGVAACISDEGNAECEHPWSDEEVWEHWKNLNTTGAAMACGTGGNIDADELKGLVKGHAFTLLDLKDFESEGETFWLLQIRNPYGRCPWDPEATDVEWHGRWSDCSPLWEQHPVSIEVCHPNRNQTRSAEDGTFWMEFGDFVEYFGNVNVCYRTDGAWAYTTEANEAQYKAGAEELNSLEFQEEEEEPLPQEMRADLRALKGLRLFNAVNDLDWEELEEDQQRAAYTLGYTAEIWDKDGDLELENLDWSELSKKQRRAAKKLGYNEERWNED